MADDQDVEVNRVRELEAMVKKLTVENKRLLTKVDTSIVKTNSQEESDEDTSLLGGEMSADVEDEWYELYTWVRSFSVTFTCMCL